MPALVNDRRRGGLRPAQPWVAITAATVFFETFQPALNSSSHTRGEPSVNAEAWNDSQKASVRSLWRFWRGVGGRSRHLSYQAWETPRARQITVVGTWWSALPELMKAATLTGPSPR